MAFYSNLLVKDLTDESFIITHSISHDGSYNTTNCLKLQQMIQLFYHIIDFKRNFENDKDSKQNENYGRDNNYTNADKNSLSNNIYKAKCIYLKLKY